MRKSVLLVLLTGCLQVAMSQNHYFNTLVEPGQRFAYAREGWRCFRTPPAPQPSLPIRIRCGRTLDQKHPLLVVDGEVKDPNTLASIHPESIARIEILKFSKATANFGRAGADGVIVITTRKTELSPVDCAEPMEEVVIRTTACYKRTACYGVLKRVSECTIECAKRTLITVHEETRQSTSKALARVYPNPAPVGGPINWTSVPGAKELQVFTVSGQWLRSLNISGQQRGQIQLNGLPAGLYLLRFMGEKNALLQTERFILQ